MSLKGVMRGMPYGVADLQPCDHQALADGGQVVVGQQRLHSADKQEGK